MFCQQALRGRGEAGRGDQHVNRVVGSTAHDPMEGPMSKGMVRASRHDLG